MTLRALRPPAKHTKQMATAHFENLLARAVRAKALTPKGRDWLTLALDPEHHKNACVQPGFPDGRPGNNIIRTINEQQTFTLPDGIDGTWSGVIFSVPELCSQELAIGTQTNHIFSALHKFVKADGTPVKWGLYNAVFIPGVAAPPFPGDFTGDFTYPAGTLFYHSNFSAYCDGQSRLVAGSYKVCNTSTVTNLGGSATAFRSVTEYREAVFTVSVTNQASTATPCTFTTGPPLTLEDAYHIPGSTAVDWKEGVYQVLTFRHPPRIGLCRYNTNAFFVDDLPNATNNVFVRTQYDALGEPMNLQSSRTAAPPCIRDAGTDVSGIFVSGLTAGMSMTLFMRTQLETFPTAHSTDITLARPAPPCDEVAWELYRTILRGLPTYAPFRANDSSMWWDVICAAGVAAAHVIPNPLFASLVMPTLSLARQITTRSPPQRGPLTILAQDASSKGKTNVLGVSKASDTSKASNGGKPTQSNVRDQIRQSQKAQQNRVVNALRGKTTLGDADLAALKSATRRR